MIDTFAIIYIVFKNCHIRTCEDIFLLASCDIQHLFCFVYQPRWERLIPIRQGDSRRTGLNTKSMDPRWQKVASCLSARNNHNSSAEKA